jgi:GntR family transcriptional regulator, gluconate operon transcriptional repressor
MKTQPFEGEFSYQQVWETICDRIRASILLADLPAGAKLVEADLAATFGVSRGPIREALRELSREGLVIDLPRRGTFVCTLTQADLIEVYGVREALEAVAVREAVASATDSELDGLVQAHRVMDEAWNGSDWNAALSADQNFHLALIKLAKNKRMETIYEQMSAQTILLIVTASQSDAALRGAPLQAIHRAILDAVVVRDAEAARRAIADHYRYTHDRLFETMRRGGGADASASDGA